VEKVHHEQVAYYRFEQWESLKHGIFTRYGGKSRAPFDSLNVGGMRGDDLQAVKQNHVLMYDALDVNSQRASTVWLVHGVDIVIVNDPIDGRKWHALADAMITDKVDTPLVMRYADCTPLMFYDPVNSAIGLAHAGWRGTVAGMASRTVKAMTMAYGSKPENIEVGIGPCIGPRRYQVGEEVVEAVQLYFGTLNGLITRDTHDGTAYFDLGIANTIDLERVGVTKIELSGICTAERTDEFYSHRAEKGQTGRFGAVISL